MYLSIDECISYLFYFQMTKFIVFFTLVLVQLSWQEELPVLEEPKETLPSTPSIDLPVKEVQSSESGSEENSESNEVSKEGVNWQQEINKLLQIEIWTEREDKLLEELINGWLSELDTLDDWSSEYDDDWWNSDESNYSDMESNEKLIDGKNKEYYEWLKSIQVKVPSEVHGKPFKRFASV